MKIIIANDHGAIQLKRELAAWLESKGHTVTNLGVDVEESVDYPDVAERAAREFLGGGYDFGIVCCGSGIGIAMAANKVKGIRCAQVFDTYSAQMCKRHNNANFLSFGGRIRYPEPVADLVQAYMDASFEGERHARRVAKLDEMGG
jgi:ribose 5-phosphate isomerase B